MTFKIYKDVKGDWRWTLYAKNGKKIADSAEGYRRRGHTMKMVYRIVATLQTGKFDIVCPE